MDKQPLQIDFVSDVVCPWCAVGLYALDRALESLQSEVDVTIAFQPFELNPQMAPEGEDIDEHLERKYGGPREKFAATRQALKERGAAVGFAFGERTRIWNTFDAHRLLAWAAQEGRQSELKHALLQAYHGEGRNVSDREQLIAVCERVGLDPDEAARMLAGDDFKDEVREAEAFWQQAGISAVPAVVINRRHLISGGQPPEVFERALREIAAQA